MQGEQDFSAGSRCPVSAAARAVWGFLSSSVRTDLVIEISILLTGHALVAQPQPDDELRQRHLIEGPVKRSPAELIEVQKD